MSPSRRSQTPEYQWEQALLDAYYDYRWHLILDPLYDNFQQWKAGEVDHDQMDEVIHLTHKQTRQIYCLFMEKRAFLIRMIQFDQDWFPAWLKDNPPPEGYPLIPVDRAED